jgi:hypothetical protein
LNISTGLIVFTALLGFSCELKAQTIVERGASKTCRLDPSDKLIYSIDSKGNRLLDFSYVGYHSGEKAIPDVPVKISLEPSRGDGTKHIQDALDKLGTLPLDEDGYRGALLLKRGVYRVGGRLIMSHSGCVLRGEGSGPDGTIIVATGYGDSKHQRTLITVASKLDNHETHVLHGYVRDPIEPVANSRQAIVDAYVPVGSHSFSVKSAKRYKVGDRILVHRPSTAKWIRSIGCDDRLGSSWRQVANPRWVKDGESPGFYYRKSKDSYSRWCILKNPGESWDDFGKRVPFNEKGLFHWRNEWNPGEYDFYFERRITSIKKSRITIDAPTVHSMVQEFGGGAIYHYETPDRVMEVGIENLRLVSEFAAPTPGHPYGNPKEANRAENHAWNGIQLKSDTENTWIRDVTGNYFGFSLISAAGKRATVQDCVSLGHASKNSGARRYTFMVNGQLNLVQRCLTYEGRHEFVTQEKTAGPNVFVDCLGRNSKSCAGPHHRYSVGTLFDNVKSGRFMESTFRGGGHGWAGTQTCFYNCNAPEFRVKAPPGGISWVLGSGKNDEEGARVTPASLYYQQVQDRLGKVALARLASKKQRENMGKYLWMSERLKNERESE